MSTTIWKSLSNRADEMARNAFSDIASLADWERERETRRREFLRCLGLDSLPVPSRELKTKVYSTHHGPGFKARCIGFELLPDCWGSAAIYYPEQPEEKAPGVLYLCGHAKIGVWHYHNRAVFWARRGYVCLIVDSIEQHDNPGEHHGLATGRQNAWLARGYTAAGGEVWNSLRALEILKADPAVDAGRIGVTGISGGGAISFFLAALAPEIKALASLCGISTARDAIGNQRLYGHCDCMYSHNLYGRDLSEYAALLAPRPALFCFGENDMLYDPDECVRFVERTKTIYALHGMKERCAVVSERCGHEEAPAFTEAIQKWFDQYVAGEERPLIGRCGPELSERTTSIFNGRPPHPNHLALLPELLSPTGSIQLPDRPEEWPEIRREALALLPPLGIEEPSSFRCDRRWYNGAGEVILSRHSGVIGEVDVGFEVRHRPGLQRMLVGLVGSGETPHHPLARLGSATASLGVFQSRLSGANFPAPGPISFPAGGTVADLRSRMVRALALTGETPVTVFYQDLRALFSYVTEAEEFAATSIYLYGRGEAGVAALYYALLHENVAGVMLEDLPASHAEGVPIFGSMKAFDLPHAVGLMAPRKVALINAGHQSWSWPTRAFERLDSGGKFLKTDNLSDAVAHLLEH